MGADDDWYPDDMAGFLVGTGTGVAGPSVAPERPFWIGFHCAAPGPSDAPDGPPRSRAGKLVTFGKAPRKARKPRAKKAV